MSKDSKMKKDVKKAPSLNVNKKVSSYQSDKGLVSKTDATTKKSK